MNIIKRNGKEVPFDETKIIAAIKAANDATVETARIQGSEEDVNLEIQVITNSIKRSLENMNTAIKIEDIQYQIIMELGRRGYQVLMYNYITYMHGREIKRKINTTDEAILSLIECENEEIKQEGL